MPDPVAGVPDKVAVPFPLSTNVTPDGSVPDSLRLGVGYPPDAVITEKLPAVPTLNVELFADVIAGA